MPRRPPPTTETIAALSLAADLCEQLAECEDLHDERDKLWSRAQAEGATYETIAEMCGVSSHTVRLHVARARGAKWAKR